MTKKVNWVFDADIRAFYVGFQDKSDAERFQKELGERLRQFGLELHPDKTRLLEFGRTAADARKRRGDGKPEAFNFLGFTHICAKTRKGRFKVLRQTIRKRLQAKLCEVSTELKRRLHLPVPKVGAWLRSVVLGHFRYYGVPGNLPHLALFRFRVARLWRRLLGRRSQRAGVTWDRLCRLIARWLPPVRAYHPYPSLRLCVVTCGKSRMR